MTEHEDTMNRIDEIEYKIDEIVSTVDDINDLIEEVLKHVKTLAVKGI